MVGYFPPPTAGGTPDGNDSRNFPSADQQRSGAAPLFRHQHPAQHHERRKGLFPVEQKGRFALQHHSDSRGGNSGQRRRRSPGLRHCGEQIRKRREHFRTDADSDFPHERNPAERHPGFGICHQRLVGKEPIGKRSEQGCPPHHSIPAGAVCGAGADPVSAQYGRHALPHRPAYRRFGQCR